MNLSSPAFQDNQLIPSAFTCDGRDISPALLWSDPPAGTFQFALVMDDPDAPGGTWTHWVIYNIPAANSGLAENIPPLDELPDGCRQGCNSWSRVGYGGPCPPSGTHHYVFRLYALCRALHLEAGLTTQQLMPSIQRQILAEAHLTGLYKREP